MRRFIFVACSLVSSACAEPQRAPTDMTPAPAPHVDNLQFLIVAYPDFLASIENGELVWRDGTRMPVSDGVSAKTAADVVDHADIDDIFTWDYPVGDEAVPPPRDYDPGRARPQPFFIKMYGDCRAGEVESRLAEVRWVDGSALKFTTVNGAHEALERVVRDLSTLGPEFVTFLAPSAGTYNCRTIAGTELYSMHAFAAAIDINTAYSDYWRWNGGDVGQAAPYRNQVPLEIVRAFERHGFIWGGRWDHYDTMHFEYRPEIILAAERRGVVRP